MYKQINIEDKFSVIRIEDNVCIPPDPLNKDYREYLAWLDDGNKPLPPDIQPVLIPTSISMRQARLALLGAGLLKSITESVSSMPQSHQIEWEYATEVKRNSPLVIGLTSALGLKKSQIDDLFLKGSKL